jgi:hypothetical protein
LPVQIRSDTEGVGNTVPYPPLVDEIRNNHGFVDLRGRPECVRSIVEAHESEALCQLLTFLAKLESPVISLGCDLGEHDSPQARWEARRVAGGYVQVADARLGDYEFSFLRELALSLERTLKREAGSDRWEVSFDLRTVRYEFSDPVEAPSIWLLFYAKASSAQRAIESRERLIRCLHSGLQKFLHE